MSKTELIMNSNPKSMFSEAIKTVRTNLAFSNLSGNMRMIIVTSPEAGDGKSFIASNLAVAYAQEKKNVLIVDCDLRKGRQHDIFGVNNIGTRGYSNLILNFNKYSKKPDKLDEKIDEYILETGIRNVSLIPSGPTPPNPIELLNSQSNENLLFELKRKFDVVILDCPPVVGLSDTLVLTKYSDSNIIVVSNKKTKLESLEKTKKTFEQIEAPITGVIINKASVKDNNYYGYYCNDYYYYNEDGTKKKKGRKSKR